MFKWLDGVANWIASLFGVPVPQESDEVKKIRQAAVGICNFLPTVETVVSVVSASSPGVVTAASAANFICGIVLKNAPAPTAAQPLTLEGAPPPPIQTWHGPNGMVIQGRFIK